MVNITGSEEMTIDEISEASGFIQEAAHEDANIIWGTVVDKDLGDEIRVTVIATGIGAAQEKGEIRRVVNGPDIDPTVIDHMDLPRYRRSVASQPNPNGIKPKSFPMRDPDDLDVPTFLRRQAD